MQELFARILNMSITAGVAIGFVVLARLALKRAPRIFSYILWSVVLFRLLCPVSVNVGYSVLELGDVSAPAVGEQVSTVDFVKEELVFPGNGLKDIPQTIPQNGAAAESRGASLPAVWLAGTAVMGLWGLWSYLGLKKRLREAAPVAPGIWETDGLNSAFVLGILRPRIYIPSGLTERQREYVLLHEKHHIRRLDPVWKALAFVALCVHWFNPLVWLAFFLSERDLETSCDEAVAAKLSNERRCDYARTLMELSAGKRRVAVMPLGFGDGNVKERVIHVLNWKRSPLWVKGICVILCTALLAACGGNPVAETTLPADNGGNEETISPEQGEQVRQELEQELEGIRQEADRVRPTLPVTQQPYTIEVRMELTEYADMELTLPADWEYEIIAYTGQDNPCGIRFWPEDCPEAKVGLYYHPGGLGVCGTGLETEEMVLENGQTVIMGYYDGSDYVSFCSYWGDYAAVCEGITGNPEYQQELIAILRSVLLNQGSMSEAEALEALRGQGLVEEEWDLYRSSFDPETGEWTFEFYDGDFSDPVQTLCVDHDGFCRSHDDHHRETNHHH